MLKKSIFTLLFCAVLALMASYSNGQEPTPKEIELANLVSRADKNLDVDESETAELYLSQAKEIITQSPGININLQGHFNKVSGKFYMKSSLNRSLEHFNTALFQFNPNSAEQMQVKFFVGIAYYYANDLETAKVYINEAKEYFIWKSDYANLAQALNNLGMIAFMQGDEEAAADLCNQALSINIELEDSLNASRNRFNLNYFSNLPTLSIEYNNDLDGGGGSSGSGTTVSTSGSGTVVVGGGHNGFAGN